MEIYERYGRALLRKAERLLQNREEAEDLVQGLFVDLWQRGETAVTLPYLFRATTNRCLNLLRDQANRARLLERQSTFLRGEPRTLCEDRAIGLDLLLKLSERLDRRELEVLIYRFYDDLTLEEIAGLLGTTRKTVGRRLEAINSRVKELQQNGGRA